MELSLCLCFLWLTAPIIAENMCTIAESCDECINTNYRCGWCYKRDFHKIHTHRCNLFRDLYAAGCYQIYSQVDQPPETESNSSECSHHGVLECGQCICEQDRHGYTCEYAGPPSGYNRSLADCINPSSSKICSDRGLCYNGSCECAPRRAGSNQRYSGKYCECDDYSCPYHDDKLCLGHGHCTCGQCVCDEGYAGEACDCPTSNKTCISSNGLVCNGIGTCECGICTCALYSSFKGPTCEDCPSCPGNCVNNKACAECVGFKRGPLTQEDCDRQCPHTTAVTEVVVCPEGKNGAGHTGYAGSLLVFSLMATVSTIVTYSS